MSSRSGLEFQRHHNQRTEPLWEGYAGHRQQVMSRIVAHAAQGGRLCVLGAGNCNDLELPTLAANFAEIALVDWDAAALLSGVARQFPAGESCVQVFGGVDLTGLLSRLYTDAPDAKPATIERFLKANPPIPLPNLGTFDVVASTCVLSQIIDSAAEIVGRQAPHFSELAVTLRRQHLGLVLNLLKPGGMGLLFTDLVSSDTAPALLTADGTDLRHLARQLLQSGNFFSGLHPGQLLVDLQTPQLFAAPPVEANVSDPWLWEVGSRRFLVVAATVRRGRLPP